jgi:hypothetical protein
MSKRIKRSRHTISIQYYHKAMTDQELRDLVASLAEDTKNMKAEASKRAAEADQRAAEASIATAELRAMQKETGRIIREIGKQIGGLSNKFGTFTEGLALPSVQTLLFERFDVEDFMPRRRRRVQDETIELDALGIVNGSRNEAYIVEIKSHLRADGVDQLLATMAKFRRMFPEYADKKVFGIVVVADANADALRVSRNAGLYVITFRDDIMQFEDLFDGDDGFVPKAY